MLVIADQPSRGECVLGHCTHCPSHHESLQRSKSPARPARGAAPKAGPVIGVKSKQGIPTRTWGWITSFLWRREYRKQCTSGRVRRRPRAVSVRWFLKAVPQGLGGPAQAGFSWNGPWKPRELHHNSIFPDLAGSMNPRSWKHSRGTSSGMCCSNILTYNAEGGGREPAQSVGGGTPLPA